MEGPWWSSEVLDGLPEVPGTSSEGPSLDEPQSAPKRPWRTISQMVGGGSIGCLLYTSPSPRD
eukprot:8212828-Alexandrium_andersonii.AAC.1